jgi:hypothetical protein
MILLISRTLLQEIVAHSSQPNLTLGAVSFCCSTCLVLTLRAAVVSLETLLS